jgi:hypothetical protein
MWNHQHSIETDATVEAVYALYADVPNWTRWDKGVTSVTLVGPFAVGSTGTITPEGQDTLPYRLVEVEPNRSFADETEIPGAGIVIRFDHLLETLPTGRTRITHGVTISGPNAPDLGPKMGPQIVSDLPEAMEALAELAARSLAR